MRANLKYSEMYEVFHEACNIIWDDDEKFYKTKATQNPYDLLTPDIYWAIIGAQYFPFKTFELQKDPKILYDEIENVLGQNLLYNDQVIKNPFVIKKISKHMKQATKSFIIRKFDKICKNYPIFKDKGINIQQATDKNGKKQQEKQLKGIIYQNIEDLDTFTTIFEKELIKYQETNQNLLKNLLDKFQNAPKGAIKQGVDILKLPDPEIYYLETEKRIEDMEQNYNKYQDQERNLLVDIDYQNSIEERIFELILKKTSFQPQIDGSDGQKETRSVIVENSTNARRQKLQGQTDDDICYVCGDGDYEDDNNIVYCDRCNISVHQRCYGIEDISEDKEWLCNNCQAFDEAKGLKVACQLCGFRGGAMRPCNITLSRYKMEIKNSYHYLINGLQQLKYLIKPYVIWDIVYSKIIFQEKQKITLSADMSTGSDSSNEDQNQNRGGGSDENYQYKYQRAQIQQASYEPQYVWIHQNCGIWLQSQCSLITSDLVFDLSTIDYSKFNLTCCYCQKQPSQEIIPFSPKYKCSEVNCNTGFHIECARKNGMHLEFEVQDLGYNFTKLYCRPHQLQKQNLIYKQMKQLKQKELLLFTRNLQTCIDNLRKHQEKNIKDAMGMDYYLVYQPDALKVKKNYIREIDQYELIRKVLIRLFESFNIIKEDKSGNKVIDRSESINWNLLRKSSGSAQLYLSGFSFKNFDGNQSFREFKKIVDNEEKFDRIQEMFITEFNDKNITPETLNCVINDQILGKRLNPDGTIEQRPQKGRKPGTIIKQNSIIKTQSIPKPKKREVKFEEKADRDEDRFIKGEDGTVTYKWKTLEEMDLEKWQIDQLREITKMTNKYLLESKDLFSTDSSDFLSGESQ